MFPLNPNCMRVAALATGCLFWAISCDAHPGESSPEADWSQRTFVVNVVDDGTTGYEIKSDDLIKHGSSFFASIRWPEVGAKSFVLSSWKAGTQISNIVVEPFMCSLKGDLANRLDQGQKPIESRTVALTPTGVLSDQSAQVFLPSECKWEAGANMGGVDETILPRVSACTVSGSAKSPLFLSGMIASHKVESQADICAATRTSVNRVEVTVSVTKANYFVASVLRLCLIDMNPATPITIDAINPQNVSPTCAPVTVSGNHDGSDRRKLSASKGSWTITEMDLASPSGEINGSVNLRFENGPDESVTLTGDFSLPIVKAY